MLERTAFGDLLREQKKAFLSAQKKAAEEKYQPPTIIVPGRLAEPSETISGAKSLAAMLEDVGYEAKIGYSEAIQADGKLVQQVWVEARKHKRHILSLWRKTAKNYTNVYDKFVGDDGVEIMKLTQLKARVLEDERINRAQTAYEWEGEWQQNTSWESTLEDGRAW